MFFSVVVMNVNVTNFLKMLQNNTRSNCELIANCQPVIQKNYQLILLMRPFPLSHSAFWSEMQQFSAPNWEFAWWRNSFFFWFVILRMKIIFHSVRKLYSYVYKIIFFQFWAFKAFKSHEMVRIYWNKPHKMYSSLRITEVKFCSKV